jgi:hypothetical protein
VSINTIKEDVEFANIELEFAIFIESKEKYFQPWSIQIIDIYVI